MKKILILLFVIWGGVLSGFSEKRLALVIGNSEYGKQNYLENPVHDAEDVASKLLYLGFEVSKLTDGTLRQMDECISDIGKKAQYYDVVLFYYSGHGLQSKGENYLMPIDAELGSEADVKYKCLPLNLLLDKLEESNCPMKIIVLDACRNNPFTKRWYRGDNALGLASVSPPKGTYITFSTAAGSVALDGMGRHSPFTQAFLEALEIPNLSLFDFFNEVGQKVIAETNGEQDPWTNHNTMKGKFYFNSSSITKNLTKKRLTSILPPWIVKRKSNEYVGISIPMDDKSNARKIAIFNALLQYIFFEGRVETAFSGERKTKNIQTKIINNLVVSNDRFSFDAMSILSNINIEIKDEYYNNNNEFFVLCSFKKNTTAENGCLVKRKLQIDEYGKSVYVTLSIDAFALNERSKMVYEFSKSVFTSGQHRLQLDSIYLALSDIDYQDCSLNSASDSNSYPLMDIRECGSLGVAELAFLAQFPLVTDSIQVYNITKMEENRNSQHINTTARFLGSSMSKPVQASIDGISNKYLCVSIKDPYDSISFDSNASIQSQLSNQSTVENKLPTEFIHLTNTDSLNNNYVDCYGEPLLLNKVMGIFSVLDMNSCYNSEITSKMSLEGDNYTKETMSTSKEIFSNYYPFFFLDKEHSDLRHYNNISKGAAVLSY